MESRWLRWVGTGVIAITAVGSVASSAVGAGQRPWTPRVCSDEPGARVAAARSATPIGLGDLRLQAWFRLDARLDGTGALQGQRLALGLDGDRSSQIVDLPPESFAAGPFGRIILVGSDDGSVSRLEALDVAGECSWAIAEESAVVRRATIDPSGETIYEMRVDRATRADLGIWSRSVHGIAPAVRVLDPIDPDERFGLTYSTEFAWALSGRRVAIQSCGEIACRTRVFDPAGGIPVAIAEPDLGAFLGLDDEVLVSYAACPGLPCPIVATDLTNGSRSILTEAAAVAVVIATPDGPRLVHEVFDEAGVGLRAVALNGSSAADVGRLPEGVRLHATPGIAEAGTRVPPGWVALSPDGRLPGGGPDSQTQLRHVPDGRTVQLHEVAR